jgi:hypothetical protein
MTVAAWCYGLLFDDAALLRNILVPASFLGLGMLVKYGDQAYDENAFSKRKTLMLAVPGGLWLGSLMAIDEGAATIFLGLLVALLLAGKYDTLPFKVGFGVALTVGMAAVLLGFTDVNVLGVAVVLAAAYLDERTNDLPGVDVGGSWTATVLHHRPFLKIAVLALCLLGLLPSLMYFFAFLSFDLGYAVVEALSIRKEVPSPG